MGILKDSKDTIYAYTDIKELDSQEEEDFLRPFESFIREEAIKGTANSLCLFSKAPARKRSVFSGSSDAEPGYVPDDFSHMNS